MSHLDFDGPAFGRDLPFAAPLCDPVRVAAKAKAAATYNAAADHFDDDAVSFWSRYGRRTVERLGLPRGARVLDVGCGTGASALPAAEIVGPEGRVVAIDLAEEMLAIARCKAAARGLDNVEFWQEDMAAMSFSEARFDAVVSVFSVFFVPDMEQQVARLWRLVRPGGKLAITTWCAGLFEPAATFFWDRVSAERPDLVERSRPWTRTTDPQSLRALLQAGGVPEPEIVAEKGKQVLRGPADWWTVVLGSGLRWTVEQVGANAAERMRAANVAFIRDKGVTAIETSPIYAVATKNRS